ncbi:MAG: hypothetical protein GY842_25765 [bacterium]|nr:hypothetical protein [bacterium]
MKFVILLDKCAGDEEFQKVVPDHVAYMTQLHERGNLIAGGPFRDATGGLIIIEAQDEAAARAIAEQDPFVSSVVEKYSLRSWEVLTSVRPDLLTRDG